MPRTRPPYPEEFRREAIRLALLGDKPQRQLAMDLGISDVTLRNWVKQERAERGERPSGLSGDEREGLGRLRDENAKADAAAEAHDAVCCAPTDWASVKDHAAACDRYFDHWLYEVVASSANR